MKITVITLGFIILVLIASRDTFKLLDNAFRVQNLLFDKTVYTTIGLSFNSDPDFNPDNENGLFDGIPSQYHRDIFHSGSAIEAWTKHAMAKQQAKDIEILNLYGESGEIASTIARWIDIFPMLFLLLVLAIARKFKKIIVSTISNLKQRNVKRMNI